MSRAPEYQIYWVDLSNAGTHEVVGAYSIFRMVWAGTRDFSINPPIASQLRLDAQVEVLFGAREDDYVPFTVNGVARGEVGRYRLRWQSQPGVWAAFLVTNNEALAGLLIEAPPARQIVTQTAGVSLQASKVAVGVSAVVAASARATRQKLTIKNNSSSTVYLGSDASVTTASGFPLDPGEGFTFEGTSAAVYAIAGAAGLDIRILEEF